MMRAKIMKSLKMILLLPVVALGLSSASCVSEEPDATQVVVVVDTDLIFQEQVGDPKEFDEIQIEVEEFMTYSKMISVAEVGPGRARPPRVVTLHFEDEIPLSQIGPFTLVAKALLNGRSVLEQRRRFVFKKDVSQKLCIMLRKSCVDMSCGDGMTCGDNGCESQEVELDAWDGSRVCP